MDNQVLNNYSDLVKLDLVINGMKSKYPFIINECAKYTQHEIQLYQQNYCNEEKTGGNDHIIIDIVDL